MVIDAHPRVVTPQGEPVLYEMTVDGAVYVLTPSGWYRWQRIYRNAKTKRDGS